MKRLCCILVAALLCCGFAGAKTGQFATAHDLFDHWYMERPDPKQSPYPDYVCGVWSTDGSMENLTIAVTDDAAGEAGKAEILALIEDDSTVTFTTAAYSHAELFAIQWELAERMGEETGMFGIGVYEMENQVHVDIDMDHPGAQTFMEECFALYGDRICFVDGDGVTVSSSDLGADLEENFAEILIGANAPLWIAVLAAIAAAGGWLLRRRHKADAAQTPKE